jgi:hypothetical protein
MGPLLLHNSASFHGDVWEHVKICRMRRNLPCRNLMQATEFTLKVNRPRRRSIRHCHFAGLRRALHIRNCMRCCKCGLCDPTVSIRTERDAPVRNLEEQAESHARATNLRRGYQCAENECMFPIARSRPHRDQTKINRKLVQALANFTREPQHHPCAIAVARDSEMG